VIAADFTTEDIGAVVCFPVADNIIVGTLTALSWPAGMVRLQVETVDGVTQKFVVDREKNITITRDHLRARALTEPDTETRGRLLLEANHIGVMQLLDDVLKGDAS